MTTKEYTQLHRGNVLYGLQLARHTLLSWDRTKDWNFDVPEHDYVAALKYVDLAIKRLDGWRPPSKT